MNQTEKADLFRSLHKKGDPIVLYNVWDAAGAKTIAAAGAKAIATGSFAVAAAHGFADGEAMPLDFALRIVERIAQAVDLPVTVDFEGGYAVEPDAVAENVRRVVQAGAIGVNFEDRVVKGDGLHAVADQAARIAAIRDVARAEGVPLFINARTDVFLASDPASHPDLVDDAIAREAAYAAAGADGFFVPGLADHSAIAKIVGSATSPVNVMMKPPLTSIADVSRLGVSRTSFGPVSYFNALKDLEARFKSLS